MCIRDSVASADPNKPEIISVKTNAGITKETPALEKKEIVTNPVTKTEQPVAAKKAETKTKIPVSGPANPVTENKKTETTSTAPATNTNIAATTNREKNCLLYTSRCV